MSGRARRRWAASFGSLVLALSVAVPATASPSGDEPVGTTTTTSLPVATNDDVLVPGDGTEGAESTTTTAPTTTVTEDSGDDGTLVALVVAGLVLVALAVAILTWRYWAATRPPPVGSDHG
jgi:hypothetical protein